MSICVLESMCLCAFKRALTQQRGSRAATEGGLTTVECRGAVDISRHERRFRLLPNRVVPHPADPTLEEGAERSEWQQTDNTLNIETRWVDFVTQWGCCNQNCRARSNPQRTIGKHGRQRD